MNPEIVGSMTVNEAVRAWPRAVEVFDRFGIDACCGGALPIAEAARRHGADAEVVLAELRRLAHAA